LGLANADLTDPAITFSSMLQQFINGKGDPSFLRSMAVAGLRAGDKAGAQIAGSAYIALLKPPLSDDDIQFIEQFTQSSRDTGFSLMLSYAARFKAVLGERKYTVDMMNMIYQGEMKDLLNIDPPDWDLIRTRIKPYGVIGQEILLRAQTVLFLNKQEWKAYVPIATEYLAKFGNNLNRDELSSFQNEIDLHKGN
jgi:hypothetical protein